MAWPAGGTSAAARPRRRRPAADCGLRRRDPLTACPHLAQHPGRERSLKRRGGARRRCPLCGVTPNGYRSAQQRCRPHREPACRRQFTRPSVLLPGGPSCRRHVPSGPVPQSSGTPFAGFLPTPGNPPAAWARIGGNGDLSLRPGSEPLIRWDDPSQVAAPGVRPGPRSARRSRSCAAHPSGWNMAASSGRVHARLRRRTPSRDTPPARPVRAGPWKTSGYTDRATGADAVRYASVDPATWGSTTRQGDTPRDRERTARQRENSRHFERSSTVRAVRGAPPRCRALTVSCAIRRTSGKAVPCMDLSGCGRRTPFVYLLPIRALCAWLRGGTQ
jgi:hypothetical protein